MCFRGGGKAPRTTERRSDEMDRDLIEGKWTEIKGRLRESYGDLTDDDIEKAKGDREQLEGMLQQKLGQTKDEARSNVDRILQKV
jgi:uncharacterized protein YjbJ (UPF0337 family)